MLRDIIEEIKKETGYGIKEPKSNHKQPEADGGYGDLGVVPTAPNPDLKKKKNLIVDKEEGSEA